MIDEMEDWVKNADRIFSIGPLLFDHFEVDCVLIIDTLF